MRLLALCALLSVAASPSLCERRNTARCNNTDSEFACPEGTTCLVASGETVGECVAAQCGAGGQSCAADTPICANGTCIKCSSTSECTALSATTPLCDIASGHCVGCISGSDCTDPSKGICDATSHACRPCQFHADCTVSGICAKDDTFASLASPILAGTCVDPSRINIVSQNCATTSCTLPIELAAVTAAKPYVHITGGSSTTKVTVPALPAGLPTFYIVGPTADTAPSAYTSAPPSTLSNNGAGSALEIPGGAHTVLEGLIIVASNTGLDCNPAKTAVTTRVKLLRSFLGANTQEAIKASRGCELTLDSSWIGKGPSPQLSSFAANAKAMTLDSTKLDIVNSVFWFDSLGIDIKDSAGLNPTVRIVNTSFIDHPFADINNVLAIDCNTYVPAAGSFSVLNTVFLNTAPPGTNVHYILPGCLTNNSIAGVASNDTNLTGTGCVTDANDSILVSAATGNMHFAAGAPSSVTNGGLTSFTNVTVPVTSPATDMEGKSRGPGPGQGPISMGAFEVAR